MSLASTYHSHKPNVPIIMEDVFGDDHAFSLLHWASKEGHVAIAELLLSRGARVNATNMGDDTSLHLAAAHGHREIVVKLLSRKADVHATNEHGMTPLHYACFWGYVQICEDLIRSGALVGVCNKKGQTPLDVCQPHVRKTITVKIAESHSGELWRGKWQGNDIVARILAVPEVTPRISRDFQTEFPALRIFAHANVCPVLACCNQPPNLIVISQFMPFGSLYNVLHEQTAVVIDQAQATKFALDIARGMSFLHSLDPMILRLYLNSKHVVVDEDLTARISMADTKFSFQETGRLYSPAWMSPEGDFCYRCANYF
ncbi:unnamed protein product [Gongylonema pulchrum]|uniref:Protein kinase domain-containing protein n=1 Tax=Gongylonema pulchrum TaxID=637853 RepID=A0A183E4V8_9BILA|nr:unnamed protein product [Gongylonema pulchrum]